MANSSPAFPRGTPRFLIGDDHPYVRIGIRQLLTDHFPGAAIAEAPDAAAIVAAVVRADEADLLAYITSPAFSIDGFMARKFSH